MTPCEMQSDVTDFFSGKRVLVTGHTGFKGSWLCEWLLAVGARPTGFSLKPDGDPCLFEQLKLEERMDHRIGDVRDSDALHRLVDETKPEVVFHLAAQALVRRSYSDPVGTYETNVIGTINLLQALRGLSNPCAAVIVTTDKCYENDERRFGFREEDTLGGHDPYSSSKACAELAVKSFRNSFFPAPQSPVRVATARAGNVIGGGDWAADRIVPDCIRALSSGKPIVVRNRHSIRPWQHVLEPLSGYLRLAAHLHPGSSLSSTMISGGLLAFNFGPPNGSEKTVEELVRTILRDWPGEWVDHTDPAAPHEAANLLLDISRARHLLAWQPLWNFERAVRETVRWYRASASAARPSEIVEMTRQQIFSYINATAEESRAPAERAVTGMPAVGFTQ